MDPYLDVVNNKYHWGATLCRVPIYTVTRLPEHVDKQPKEHQQKTPRVSNMGVSIIYIYIIPSASRSHKFVGIFPKTRFFFSYEKTLFVSENMFFSLLGKRNYFFSHVVP